MQSPHVVRTVQYYRKHTDKERKAFEIQVDLDNTDVHSPVIRCTKYIFIKPVWPGSDPTCWATGIICTLMCISLTTRAKQHGSSV